ncbi:MAG: sugar phosphate isomerase/epimerase family protein [Chloroflexota bacterium]
METPPYQFGISEFTTWPWSFEEDVRRYAELGVDTIEVCEFKLSHEHLSRQLASIADHGLGISSVQPATRTLFPSQSQPEPKDLPDRIKRFRGTITSFGDLARGVPFVTNTGNPPGGNIQEVIDTAVREYRELARFAADAGARVALEPLNASIMNVESAIWTLRQGMDIVKQVEHPNFGICLDAWNIWQNAGILDEIRAAGDRIFVVQLSDWRTPRSYQDRVIPGQGEIPLAQLMRAVHESGYRGPYVVEIFSGHVPDSLWEGDLEKVITQSRDGVNRAWEAAWS